MSEVLYPFEGKIKPAQQGNQVADAGDLEVDATGFNRNLSSSDTTVQHALATLDQLNQPQPAPSTVDLRYGLSTQSDPALVDFTTLTDVSSPTDPQTVSTGVTSAGQYFHIFSANAHDIQTITDTVLQQVVYRDGATGNIFTKANDVRTENTVTYDSYTIGPLNAGVDEDYVIAFS